MCLSNLRRLLCSVTRCSFLQELNTANFLANLYEGQLRDYVTCLHCHCTQERIVGYQDVSLPVKGSRDLQEALRRFTEPELLHGDNQYQCSFCKVLKPGVQGAT